ncbi:MAG: hypothetical protein AAGK97_08210 [Bacteroidota bacterium]
MELFTLASIVTIVITGALTRTSEIILDETINKFRQLLQAKSPETMKKLQESATRPDTLQETIEVMATLIDSDTEVKEVAEKIAKENESKSYVINTMKNVGIVNHGAISNPVFNFN